MLMEKNIHNEVPESLTLNSNYSISLDHDTEKDCKRRLL